MRRRIFAILVSLAAIALISRLPPLVAHETASRIGLAAFLSNRLTSSSTLDALTDLSNQDCSIHRFRGLVADRLGRVAESDESWWALTACPSDVVVGMLRGTLSQRTDLAEAFARSRPDSVDAWLWLAETATKSSADWAVPQTESERLRVIEAYRRALALSPSMSVTWVRLGYLLAAQNDPSAAIEAYLNACRTGDAGFNGCYRAGLTAEGTGDIAAAIQYYRLSRWPPAWQQADQLEQQLNSTK